MNFFFKKYKNIPALLLTIAVLAVAFSFLVKEARADVPVFDENTHQLIDTSNRTLQGQIPGAGESLYALRLKSVGPTPFQYPTIPTPCEQIMVQGGVALDKIGYCVSRTILRALTTSLVNWIRTGGIQGSPLYVEDFGTHFGRELDNAAGIFLERVTSPEFMNKICSPFRVNLGNLLNTTLSRGRGFEERARCTLSQIISNIENFRIDFTQGGSAAWEALLEPQNNPIGSFLTSLDEAAGIQSETLLKTQTELQTTGGGLLAYKKCEETDAGYAIDCEIVTPGGIVAEAARETFGIDVDSLKVADSINEVVGVLLEQITSWALTGGGSFKSFDTERFRIGPDSAPPSVSVTSPPNNSTVSGTTTVSAVAFDNIAVLNVQFLLDGRNLGLEVFTLPYSAIWDTRTATSGPHILSAKARDTSGNTGLSLQINVTVASSTATSSQAASPR